MTGRSRRAVPAMLPGAGGLPFPVRAGAEEEARAAARRKAWCTVWAITLCAEAAHLMLAALVPPFQDEGYYALWARHLAWDYYDHPPMIALWIRGGEALAGQGVVGLRLACVLGFALVPPLCARMAARLGAGPATIRRAALVSAGMVLPLALGFAATPDAPSTFFWTLAAAALVEARAAHPSGRPMPYRPMPYQPMSHRPTAWWVTVGAAAGLGVLSKFTGFFLGLGLAGWLLATVEGRRALRGPGPWVALTLAAALLVPLLLWNAAHGWLGVQRQFGRLAVAAATKGHVAAYLGTTLATVTPPILWAAARGAARQPQARPLLWLILPLPAYLLVHSAHAAVQANWLVPVFPLLAVLAAFGLEGVRPLWRRGAVGLPAALAALGLALALWPGRPVFPGDNPANQTKGWDALATRVEGMARTGGARWIATADYGTTGALSFRLRDLPVRQVTEGERYGFLGPFPAALCAAPGLMVTRGAPPASVLARFVRLGPAVVVARRSQGAVIARYTLRPVAGLRPCPPW